MNRTQLTPTEELKNHEVTINSLLESRNLQVDNLQKQLEEALVKVEEAKKEKAVAERELNTELYADATKKQHEAEFLIRGNEKLVGDVNQRPMLEQSSYEKMINDIKHSMDRLLIDAKKDIKPLIESVESVENKVIEYHLLTDRLLHLLQREVQKRPNVEEIIKDGRVQRVGILDEKYQKPTMDYFLTQAKANLKKFTGEGTAETED